MKESGMDVVSFLKEQHQEVKQLFETVLASQGEVQKNAFYKLRRMLAVHETAEEEIVHPAAKRALANGEAIINARLGEENEAKKVLTRLETLEIGSPEFISEFKLFREAVLAHANAEETQEFVALARTLDQSQLTKMTKEVEAAEAIAPTRPHAGVESPLGNMVAGPFASVIDRTRDAVTGKNK